jgi:lipopolysaccharide transport system ATP-binding protein
MPQTVITVENLSKSYLIGHRSGRRERYGSLRDAMAREFRNFARKAADVIHGKEIVQGDEVEEFWALRDVNFEVKQGEVIGFMGRNGAGKSTLLKILSRITDPTEGRIRLRGRVASLLEVGTGFHPELTGRENIFLNGAILGMSKREILAKFDEIVAFAEVERFLDTPVKRYSSGMYVRLAFAVAAHLEPEILIIDEVLAVGDGEFQKKCLGKMSQVARGGRTVLFVSHNMGSIRNLCTHGIVLRAGKAAAKEDVLSAINRYSSEFEAATMAWERPTTIQSQPVQFQSIQVGLEGTQPKLALSCRFVITYNRDSRPSLIAVDVLDPSFSTIMQAEPKSEPFIGGDAGSYCVDLSIELPPLVPGTYHLDFWLGPHNSQTFDCVKHAISVKIVDNPRPGRTFPYTPDHGFISPLSTAVVTNVAVKHQPAALIK